jgi:hypothetical protein
VHHRVGDQLIDEAKLRVIAQTVDRTEDSVPRSFSSADR